MRRCTKCEELKSPDNFYNDKNNKRDGLCRHCKICMRNDRRVWAKTKGAKKFIRNQGYKSRYGISYEVFEEMLKSCDYTCHICGCKVVQKHGGNKACLDHCHTTGNLRGVLCNRCNKGIGLLDDSVDVLQKAIDYLQKY